MSIKFDDFFNKTDSVKKTEAIVKFLKFSKQIRIPTIVFMVTFNFIQNLIT